MAAWSVDRIVEVTDFSKPKKPIRARINRRCLVCGRRIQVTVYEDDSYCGGEYFGRMPEFAMRKRPGGYDPLVAEEIWRHSDEYWECPSGGVPDVVEGWW